ELKAALAYSGETFQIELAYYLSQFTNGNKSLTWENPYDITAFSDPTVARISLPPDNTHNKFSLTGGINLPFATRISAIAEYGMMKQNDVLFPYSYNSSSTITTPLPRATADAEIDTAHLELNISSRPVSRLGLAAKYRYYETDNETPRDLFLYVNNDTGGAQSTVTATNSEALYNLPYDFTQSKTTLDASYYLFSGTTLKLGYDYDIIERDYREVNRTIENTYRARLNSNLSSFASAGINFAYGERRIFGQYDEAAVYDAYHIQEYVSAQQAAGTAFDNNPFLRKYDIADRDRTKYGANITLFPHYTTTIGLYYSAAKADYEGSLMGLKNSKNNTYTVDMTYVPM
ncbi:MAG: MtrB/PioB family outer membrane beta-barrel protein, partial [Nanoarchaeota archaeon]